MELGGGPIGTLEVYGAEPRGWDESEVSALQTYTGVVASLLAAAPKAQLQGSLAEQLQVALDSRVLIERAKGALMERERLDEQEAFTHLRRAARSSGRTLNDVAAEVAAGHCRAGGPGHPGPGHRRPTAWLAPARQAPEAVLAAEGRRLRRPPAGRALGRCRSAGDGRDDRLADQLPSVHAVLGGVTGDDHHQSRSGTTWTNWPPMPIAWKLGWPAWLVTHHW